MRNKFLFIFFIILLFPGCATKSHNFVGIHFVGQNHVLSVVANSAMVPVENFIRGWLDDWESGQFKRCYNSFSKQIQRELSIEQFHIIQSDLNKKYGQTQKTVILDLPITKTFPLVDEALFKKTASNTLTYYDYVLARYLNHRIKHNLVYFIGVGMKNEKFEIVSFGAGEESFRPEEENNYLFWFGYPSF